MIANAFRQKLRKWPKIQNHDYAGLRNFSDYLNNVLVAKESNQFLAILDDENENRILLYSKGKPIFSTKWQRKQCDKMPTGVTAFEYLGRPANA